MVLQKTAYEVEDHYIAAQLGLSAIDVGICLKYKDFIRKLSEINIKRGPMVQKCPKATLKKKEIQFVLQQKEGGNLF